MLRWQNSRRDVVEYPTHRISALRTSNTPYNFHTDLSAVGQASKLRQASIALRKAEAETGSMQYKGVGGIDLDQPLDSVVHSKLGDSHYERCKLLLPAVVDPCDTLVSLLPRETRHLTLRDVWGTRTQEFQRKQFAERTRISPSGDTFVEVVHSQPKEGLVEKTLATYLFKRITLTIANAEAGSVPITPPSGSLPRRVGGSDVPLPARRSGPEIAYLCGSRLGC